MNGGGFVDAFLDAFRGVIPESFRSSEDAHARLVDDAVGSDNVSAATIGSSEEGRPIHGFVAGTGEMHVTLIAGSHADEPVGPETLRAFVAGLARGGSQIDDLLGRFRFFVVPHVNPDGEARNRAWTERWPDVASFLEHAVREEPGRDIEFGYPDMRAENRAVAAFLAAANPVSLHMSLHGMAFARGALLLIDRIHAPHAGSVRSRYAEAVREAGLELHDENRMGEKGFFYLGPGFWTTPAGEAMRRHFQLTGEPDMSARFRSTSMEYVASLGGLPLSLVTEVPLFVFTDDVEPETLASIRAIRREKGADRSKAVAATAELLRGRTRPVPLRDTIMLQLSALAAGLAYVARPRTIR